MQENKKSLQEQYKELSEKSLVRVQYSCCGMATSIDEAENIPIVTDSLHTNETQNEDKTKNS